LFLFVQSKFFRGDISADNLFTIFFRWSCDAKTMDELDSGIYVSVYNFGVGYGSTGLYFGNNSEKVSKELLHIRFRVWRLDFLFRR
jgi:hypothetical protein